MRFLLDKNVVIYLQKGDLNESLPPAFYSISIITEMELLSYPMSDEDINWLHRFIGAVEIIGLTKEVKELAIELRRSHKLRLPDAIVAASALLYDAVLLSNENRGS
jgi:predicted nucleic acid-binding protein